MAKAQEYKLSGSTGYRAEDPRAQAVETLAQHISANHPEIMAELAIAHATYRPSWIKEHPTAVVYDTEDESRYHYDVDKKTSAGKLFDDFQDAPGLHDQGTGAGSRQSALTERLHMPVGNALGAIGVDYHDQATEPHTVTPPDAGGPAHRPLAPVNRRNDGTSRTGRLHLVRIRHRINEEHRRGRHHPRLRRPPQNTAAGGRRRGRRRRMDKNNPARPPGPHVRPRIGPGPGLVERLPDAGRPGPGQGRRR